MVAGRFGLGIYQRGSMYHHTHYRSPCCSSETIQILIPFHQWLKDHKVTRDKGYTLLKRHKLLCQKVKGKYYVVENPENPITPHDLAHRMRGKKRHGSQISSPWLPK